MSDILRCYKVALRCMECQDVIHSETCLQFAGNNLKNTLFDAMVLFFPIALIPLIPKLQQLDRDLLLRTLKDYAIMVGNGYLAGNIALLAVCGLRNLLGGFYYTTTLIIPGVLSSVPIFFLPEHIQVTHGQTLFNMASEALIRRSDSKVIRAMRKSRIFGTFCFALMSARILQILRYSKLKSFWFVQPKKHKSDAAPEKYCLHDKSCLACIKEEMLKYAKVGAAVVLAKKIIFKFNSIAKNPLKVFQKMDYCLIAFLTSYIGLYRATSCWMNNYFKAETKFGNLMAGLIGGLAYYFYPNYNFFTLAMTIFISLNFEKFRLDTANSKNKIIAVLRKFPLQPLAYILGYTLILESRLLYPWALSPMGKKMPDYLTHQRSVHIGESIFKQVFIGAGN